MAFFIETFDEKNYCSKETVIPPELLHLDEFLENNLLL